MPQGDHLPRLTQAAALFTFAMDAVDETGLVRPLLIPAERPLTVYIDRQEIVTLMTLGQNPEWLVLGYIRNQNLIADLSQIESVTVDWEVGAAAVATRTGQFKAPAKDAPRVVTTGCGQGSMFGHLYDQVSQLQLPDGQATQAQLFSVIDQVREHPSVYKQAGSMHGCALFDLMGDDAGAVQDTPLLRLFIEDVGRHNALDTLSGWDWLQSPDQRVRRPLVYTTGRLTSEMMMKAAQMAIPIVMSRSGTTQMGWDLANRLGLCVIGRAKHRRYLCFAGGHRIVGATQPG
jgi:FdhD protein